MRDVGREYGTTTGRPRRCGWFDAVAVRYAARVNGLDALALTKLDVLDGLDEILVCTAYRIGGRTVTEFPTDVRQLEACEPVFERLAGWTKPTRGARADADLPAEARAYVRRLEEISGISVTILSTGSDRDDTIIRDGSIAARWFGDGR
jgi:adenylosuccinate synthase